MRYPNKRHGSPTAITHYAMWYGTVPELARSLRWSERSVTDWLSGRPRVPWWVSEIMRLQKMEHDAMVYEMTGQQVVARLGDAAAGAVVVVGARFRPAPVMPDGTPSDSDDQAPTRSGAA